MIDLTLCKLNKDLDISDKHDYISLNAVFIVVFKFLWRKTSSVN